MSGTDGKGGNSQDPIGEETRPHDIHYKAVCLAMPEMIEKLDRNSHKGHWGGMSDALLLIRLQEERHELERAVAGGDHSKICEEAIDVMNFALFMFDNHRKLRGRDEG